MLKRTSHLRPASRRLISSVPSSSVGPGRIGVTLLVSTLGVTAAGLAYFASADRKVYAEPLVAELDPSVVSEKKKTKRISSSSGKTTVREKGELDVFFWGSNSNNVLGQGVSSTLPIKYPRLVAALSGPGVAFRDLTMEETYGAVVDAAGDLYMWGKKISDGEIEKVQSTSGGLKRCLVGLNITHLAAAKSKLYALSSSGTVYCLPTGSELQQASDRPLTKRSFWARLDFLHLFTTFIPDQPVDYVSLDYSTPEGLFLNKREKVTQIDAGKHHLLALTNQGRVFGHAISELANSNHQLVDMDSIVLPSPTTSSLSAETRAIFNLTPLDLPDYSDRAIRQRAQLSRTADPFILKNLPQDPRIQDLSAVPTADTARVKEEILTRRGLKPEEDIRWSTTLYEIPVLNGIKVDQVAAGERTSFIRSRGRVLGWGANEYGQIGLGSRYTTDNITSPTEVIFTRLLGYNTSSGINCTNVTIAANTTYFTISRVTSPDNKEYIDLLAAGHGVRGELGNGQWNQVSGGCVKVKGVSGLIEYSELENKQVPLSIHNVSTSKSGHTAVSLNTSPLADKDGGFAYGRDVMIWGYNASYQLGTGKRSNLAIPQHISPLPSNVSSSPFSLGSKESLISSGTASPMPHSRLQLGERVIPSGELRDLQGRKVGGGKKMVEQVVHAGYESSAVYWKLV
ncbi:FOG: RCC1 domain [Phaffia rhodozyma]|uniref:FOG: RCC1 domain n=1 Tax=Phaffia rhodozyma TaxID=264483 RepID=A0A0F7SFM5_PHARH|nr:FOG: RCC1 domain [Phaffia rhodozyma]